MLTEESEKLLQMLVEASRTLRGDERRSFQVHKTSDSGRLVYEVFHRGFPGYKREVHCADLDELECQNLIRYSSHHRTLFDVTSGGYEFYQEILEREGNPLTQIESSLLNYLDDTSFKGRFPAAYEKWMRAAHALVAPGVESQLTQIGHDCREAMQEFATALVNEFRPAAVQTNTARTVSRIRAILELQKSALGEAHHAFLDALLIYWGAVNDLVQRQEHGGQKENRPLVWADARRVVFHTGIVMFELDLSLHART